jgi:hypothetical protein
LPQFQEFSTAIPSKFERTQEAAKTIWPLFEVHEPLVDNLPASGLTDHNRIQNDQLLVEFCSRNCHLTIFIDYSIRFALPFAQFTVTEAKILNLAPAMISSGHT